MKTKLLPLFVFLLSLTITAQVNTISETFEAVTENQVPAGWQKYGVSYPYTAGAYTFSSWAYQGTKSLMINNYTTAGDVYIILPQTINARGILSFYARSINGNATIQLGSATSNTDMSTFMPIGSAYVVTTSYANINLDLNTHTRNDEYVVIRATNPSTLVRVCLDNVTYNTTCKFDQNVKFTNATDTSLDMTWNTDSGTSVDVNVVANNQLQSSGATYNTILNTAYTISGLAPSTHYDIYVRMNCNTSFSSPWVKYDVKTACSAVALTTITDSFESSTAGQTPQCWFNTEAILTSSVATAIHTGSKGIVMDGAVGANRFLVSPKLDATIDGIFTFYTKNGTGTVPTNVLVGTVESPNALDTFVQYQNIGSVGSAWTQYTINFSGNANNHRYIAIKHVSTSVTDRFVIDDVTYLPAYLNSQNFTKNNLKVALYPNPAKDVIKIEMDSELKLVEIYNIQGQKVLSSTSNNVTVSDLSSGIFMVRIEDENGITSTQKLVKE
jgi:hypothetical protein